MARSRPGDRDPAGVEGGAAHEPDARDERNHTDGDHGIPRRVAQDVHAQRDPEIVRQEQRRDRNHDQVVEEERPAGEKAEQVVESPANECRGAAGLRDRGRPLRVGERDDQEDDPRHQQHERGEPERVAGNDAEREVDRGGDLAVGDGEERRCVEHALEAAQLPRHYLPPFRSSVSRPTPSAMNSAPSTKPSTPPPLAAVTTRSAMPIPTKTSASTATTPR